MEFQRARSKEHKDQRWDEIIDATLKIYASRPFHEITLTQIAQELSFTRENLYKYVKTKEEIFLKIILRELQAWTADLQSNPKLNGKLSDRDFAKEWSKAFARHSLMLEHIALLHTIMEKNVSLEALTTFKRSYFEELGTAGSIMQKSLPWLDDQQIIGLLGFLAYLSTGLLPLTRPNEVQQEAIRQAGIQYVIPDFEETLRHSLEIYLKGLRSDKD
jgi:AcrR family transcriptional regulator